MHPNAILHEVQQLYNVSDRLDSPAEILICTKLLSTHPTLCSSSF